MNLRKTLAPGIRCTKLRLDLVEADWSERVFRVAIALILPTAIPLRVMDLVTTYIGLNMGVQEVNPVSALVLGAFGFAGLILLHTGVIAMQLFSAWCGYGKALRYYGSTRKGARGAYFLLEFLVIVVLLLPFFVETSVVTSNLQVILR